MPKKAVSQTEHHSSMLFGLLYIDCHSNPEEMANAVGLDHGSRKVERGAGVLLRKPLPADRKRLGQSKPLSENNE